MTTTTDREPDAGSGTSPDDGTGTVAARPTTPTGRGARLVRGRPDDPRWVRPTLLGLLVVTAVTYLWNLGASGWANSFYAAAVQAGTQSTKAWLFGALDAPGTVTVDKPPAAMWVMALSGRIFGFSSWSMLVPQALMGVASVALLYAAVRRWSGPRTALAAAALLAFMPVAVLMFRFNNPDALLVLLMVAAAYTTVRAVDAAGRRAGTGWLVATGVLIGFGFLTKQLQVMLAVPALALVYLLCAPTTVRRRILDLLAGGVAMVVSAGWYVALVDLWPASSRPYIGGSTDNSLLQLALGYNGLGRIVGGEGGPGGGRGGPRGGLGGAPGAAPGGGAAGGPGGFGGGPGGPGGGGPGGPGGGGFGGQAGPLRLLTDEFSANASWLLPAALVLLVAALWFCGRAPRTDRTRAALVLWGGWTLVHVVVFSAMSGIIHPYYTVALAPGVAATTALGASVLWRHRATLVARIVLAVSVLGTAVWSTVILTQNDELGWLRWVVVAFALIGAVLLLATGRGGVWARRLGVVTVLASLIGGVGASTALAAVTAATPTQGSIVSAGTRGGMGGPGGPGGRGARTPGDRGGRIDARRGGGPEGEAPSPQLVAMLRSAGTTWAAATTGAMSAAPLQLDSGVPVMSIGGFMGSDPAPTLAEFQQDVAAGKIRYFVEGGGPGGFGGPGGRPGGASMPGAGAGGRGGPGSRGTAGEITTWVTQHYTSVDVGGHTVYDLSRPKA